MTSVPLQSGILLNQRYLVMEALGQGGMGTVYKAEHIRLHAIVAVKEIRGLGGDESQHRQELDRCEHEARFLVHLNHPNLPKVTDAFIENDCFYLVMDYIEGLTLDSCLTEAGGKPLDILQSIEWGLQIADVLAYLHSQDPAIIFRDLKPSNVMVLPDGTIKLIDFGIARHFQPGAVKDTSLLGSVGYSPPEQFGKGQTDARSDVYAFGATLHHLITGRDPALQPFKFPPARTFNSQVPASLSHLLDMCLALDPDQRPESANVVAIQLLAIREELLLQRAKYLAQQTPHDGAGRNFASFSDRGPNGKHADTILTSIEGKQSNFNSPPGGAAGRERAGSEKSTSSPVRVTSVSQARPRQEANNNASPRNAITFIVLLLLSIIGGGIAVAVFWGHSKLNNQGSKPIITAPLQVVDSQSEKIPPDNSTGNPLNGTEGTSKQPGQMVPGKETTPSQPVTAQPNPSQPVPSSSGATSNSTTNSGITLQTALLAVNNEMLPIAVSGTIKGMGNTPLKLAIYFFDAKGQPLDSLDINDTSYTNEQKFLCTYKTITVATDDYTVRETLPIPVRLLTGSQHPGPFTYQAMLFQEGRHLPIYKTDFFDLRSDTYSGTDSSSHPPASGNGNSSSSSLLVPGSASRHNVIFGSGPAGY